MNIDLIATRIRILLLACFLSFNSSLHSQTNIVSNGGFETLQPDSSFSLAPWYITGVTYINEAPKASEGRNFWAGGGFIFQDLATVAGQNYLLTFAFGGNEVAQINLQPLLVTFGTRQVTSLPVTLTKTEYPEWKYLSYLVTADSSLTRLEFHTRYAFPYIDDVSVVAVPEPNILCMAGLALVCYYLRRAGFSAS